MTKINQNGYNGILTRQKYETSRIKQNILITFMNAVNSQMEQQAHLIKICLKDMNKHTSHKKLNFI